MQDAERHHVLKPTEKAIQEKIKANSSHVCSLLLKRRNQGNLEGQLTSLGVFKRKLYFYF